MGVSFLYRRPFIKKRQTLSTFAFFVLPNGFQKPEQPSP